MEWEEEIAKRLKVVLEAKTPEQQLDACSEVLDTVEDWILVAYMRGKGLGRLTSDKARDIQASH